MPRTRLPAGTIFRRWQFGFDVSVVSFTGFIIYPAIIDMDTWDAVQAVNKQAKKCHASRREPEKEIVFRHTVLC